MKKLLLIFGLLITFVVTKSYGIINVKNTDACAQIVLKNGDIVEATILEITLADIKYKKCANDKGTEINISKREVLSVLATDGEVIYRNTESDVKTVKDKSIDPFTIVSLITGILGILIFMTGFGGISGILGTVFGGISLYQIKESKGKKIGKGMAIAGLVTGIIGIAIFIVMLVTGGFIVE